jgi:hypothetical protein
LRRCCRCAVAINYKKDMVSFWYYLHAGIEFDSRTASGGMEMLPKRQQPSETKPRIRTGTRSHFMCWPGYATASRLWPGRYSPSARPSQALRGRCIMSDALKRAEHYRDVAKRYLRLAAISSRTENRNHYLRIAQHYNTLAEAEELRTLGT